MTNNDTTDRHDLIKVMLERNDLQPSQSPLLKVIFHPPGGAPYLSWTFHTSVPWWQIESRATEADPWDAVSQEDDSTRQYPIIELTQTYRLYALLKNFERDWNYSPSNELTYFA